MERHVSAITLRRKLGEVMEEVRHKGLQVVVERAGRPMVAMVPLEFYQSWKEAREKFFRKVREVRRENPSLSPEKVSKLVDEAKGKKGRTGSRSK